MSIIFCENYEQCFKGYKAVAPSIYADDADVLDKLCTCIDFSWKEDADFFKDPNVAAYLNHFGIESAGNCVLRKESWKDEKGNAEQFFSVLEPCVQIGCREISRHWQMEIISNPEYIQLEWLQPIFKTQKIFVLLTFMELIEFDYKRIYDAGIEMVIDDISSEGMDYDAFYDQVKLWLMRRWKACRLPCGYSE